MRRNVRFATSALIVIVFLLLLLTNHLEDLWEQYNVTAYVRTSLKNSIGHKNSKEKVPASSNAGDKVIVMAKMEKENTNWVDANLPEYIHTHLAKISAIIFMS